jgi:hypothetical protein
MKGLHGIGTVTRDVLEVSHNHRIEGVAHGREPDIYRSAITLPVPKEHVPWTEKEAIVRPDIVIYSMF